MKAFHTLRRRLSAVVILAMLVHGLAPALHARAERLHGPGEWAPVCSSSAAAAGDVPGAAAPKGSKARPVYGDHHCPSCATHFTAAPVTAPGFTASAPAAVRQPAAEQLAPDRVIAWSAVRSRGPPLSA